MKTKMTKLELAEKIEMHHLYEPHFNKGIFSKNYYRYDREKEIEGLMKHSKAELIEMYEYCYSEDGRELNAHEINW